MPTGSVKSMCFIALPASFEVDAVEPRTELADRKSLMRVQIYS